MIKNKAGVLTTGKQMKTLRDIQNEQSMTVNNLKTWNVTFYITTLINQFVFQKKKTHWM